MSCDEQNEHEQDKHFVEGRDYYYEDGLMVLTSSYLLARGYCCGRGCRHCPFPQDEERLEQKDV